MANEKLGNKIREQSKAIMALTSEKEMLLEQVTKLQKSYSRTKMDLEKKLTEGEQLRALQSHSAHQQVILNQLKSRLEEHEVEQDEDMKTKEATIEDLHLRLKKNIESIHKLNQQLASLQKDNVRLRSELEREIATRQSLEMQLQGKDQLVESLRSQLDSNSYKRLLEKTEQYKDPEKLVRTAVNKLAEEGGVTDPHSLDKAYWIQRVGELSIQLQQSSEYWSDKVRDLSSQLEKTRSASISTKVF
ncbi:golgin subfamily b member 1-like [Plakobranchus ocellatus]|uniref:Golgin subfamily b member 1-like n=1 Tax=Plakobranchus ocellatus TaxID=259542 RepID=A0AAV3YRS5_9GAST|nr:golgin subfamily b member 1-like [Plakobranchus ocellatus]